MEHLGQVSISLPSSLAELDVTSPPFADATRLNASQLAPWALQARQQPVTSLKWGAVLAAVKAGPASETPQLVSLLAWAAQAAVQQLQLACTNAAGGGGNDAAAGADRGNPRHLLALRNTLKLSLFFLCSLVTREPSSSGEQAGGRRAQEQQHGGSKKARAARNATAADASAAACALRLRHDALLAIAAIEDAVWASSRALLPAVCDLRAAARLIRASALHCLTHPLPLEACSSSGPDRATKALQQSCSQALTDLLARPFVAADRRQGHAAAAQALADLLAVACEPKQPPQVLAVAVQLVGSVHQQCSKAGVALVAGLTDLTLQLADSSSSSGGSAGAGAGAGSARQRAAPVAAAAVAGLQLDACLHFFTLLTAGPTSQLLVAVLLACPRLLPLASASRSSTRRLVLDLCSNLLPAAARLVPNSERQVAAGCSAAERTMGDGAVQMCIKGEAAPVTVSSPSLPPSLPAAAAPSLQSLLLAALLGRLGDRDATLRAKALGCLERHVQLVAAHLSSNNEGQDVALACLLPAMCARLCDKSPSVRKKAGALLAALLEAGLTPLAAARLADAVLPVAGKLLSVRPDSALHLGEGGCEALGLAVLRMAAAGSSHTSLLQLMQLATQGRGGAAQPQLQAALLGMLLPASSRRQAGREAGDSLLAVLAPPLASCSRRQLAQLRSVLQAALGRASTPAREAVCEAVQLCYQRLQSVSAGGGQGAAAGDGLAAAQQAASALAVLGPLSDASDGATGLAEAGLLLSSLEHVLTADRLASNSAGGTDVSGASDSDNTLTLSCLLESLALAAQHLTACAEAASSPASSQAAPSTDCQQAATVLAHAALPTLLAVLLSPAAASQAVRGAAIAAALAFPTSEQAPLWLLRRLTAAATLRDKTAAGFSFTSSTSLAAGQASQAVSLQLEEGPQGELLLVPAGGTCSTDVRDVVSPGADPAGATLPEAAALERRQQAEERKEQQRCVTHRALLALLELLGGMAGGYELQRAAFLQRLRLGGASERSQQVHTSKAGRPLRPAAQWWVGDAAATEHEPAAALGPAGYAGVLAAAAAQGAGATTAAAGGSSGDVSSTGDYMQAEAEAVKHEVAAQRFSESLLAAADSPPACYLPLLEQLAAGEGGEVPSIQAAALTALGKLALLTEPLCRRCVALAESCLISPSENVVQEAAVAVLADAIDCFPTSFGSRLLAIGQRMAGTHHLASDAPAATPALTAGTARPASEAAALPCTSDGSEHLVAARPKAAATDSDTASAAGGAAEQGRSKAAGCPGAADPRLARAAAAAYCRLLLRNKLKLQGVLGPLGATLAGGGGSKQFELEQLAAHTLRQLLAAAAPKERSRLCMDLFHQTPLSCRLQLAVALTSPAARLLTPADMRSDLLCGQAAQALLAAAGSSFASGSTGHDTVQAVAHLLRDMQPSGKVLATLAAQLQAGGGGNGGGPSGCLSAAPPSLLAQLPLAAKQALRSFITNHVPASAAAEGGEAASDGHAGTSHKRKRNAKAGSAALQQQLLGLLAGGGEGSGGGGGGTAKRAGRPPRPASSDAAAVAASGAASFGARTRLKGVGASSAAGADGSAAAGSARRSTRSGGGI